jgi:hypothetical protein
MANKSKSRWSLDSIKIYLYNDKGDEIILNSGDLTDYTISEIMEDVELYVNNSGGNIRMSNNLHHQNLINQRRRHDAYN